MTLDDLIKIGEDAWNESYDSMEYDERKEADKADRARYRAVVLALRDEMTNHVELRALCGRMGPDVISGVFNDILGDAVEKAAGGPNSNAGDLTCGVTAPAADPSPVCEWAPRKNEPGFCSTPHGVKFRDGRYSHCGICGLPIKFKEPSHD